MPADPLDPATLLCERCGYVVDGLPPAGACPECGKPIAESLPARRAGSPWQRSRTIPAAAATCWAMWTSPRRVFDDAAIALDRARPGQTLLSLADLCHYAAAFLATLPVVLTAGGSIVVLTLGRGSAEFLPTMIWLVVLVIASSGIALPVTLLFAALSGIERAGIQFFGRTRRWRVSPVVASVVCAHAAAGWVAGGLIGVGLCAGAWAAALLGETSRHWALTALAPPLLGFLIGLLWFEILVYVGVRRCRFANHAAPSPPPGGGGG